MGDIHEEAQIAFLVREIESVATHGLRRSRFDALIEADETEPVHEKRGARVFARTPVRERVVCSLAGVLRRWQGPMARYRGVGGQR